MLPRLDKAGYVIPKMGTPPSLFLFITITATIFQIWLARKTEEIDVRKTYGPLLFPDENLQYVGPSEPTHDVNDPSGGATDNQTAEETCTGSELQPYNSIERVIDIPTPSSQTVHEDKVWRIEREFQIACGVIGLTAAIFGVYTGILGNSNHIFDRMVLFEVSVWLLHTSFLSGMLMLAIAIMHPDSLDLCTAFYGIMSIAVGSLTYAISFGIYLLLPKSMVRLIIVSVLPAALFLIAIIIHLEMESRTRFRSLVSRMINKYN